MTSCRVTAATVVSSCKEIVAAAAAICKAISAVENRATIIATAMAGHTVDEAILAETGRREIRASTAGVYCREISAAKAKTAITPAGSMNYMVISARAAKCKVTSTVRKEITTRYKDSSAAIERRVKEDGTVTGSHTGISMAALNEFTERSSSMTNRKASDCKVTAGVGSSTIAHNKMTIGSDSEVSAAVGSDDS